MAKQIVQNRSINIYSDGVDIQGFLFKLQGTGLVHETCVNGIPTRAYLDGPNVLTITIKGIADSDWVKLKKSKFASVHKSIIKNFGK